MFLHFILYAYTNKMWYQTPISKNIKHVIFQNSFFFVPFIYIVVMHSKSYVFVHDFSFPPKV
jgi:hypothetical protein